MRRKLIDCQLAFALESEFGKEAVFTFYANSVPLGPSGGIDIIGIEAAAREYLGHSVMEVQLEEAATLAALIRRPGAFLKFVRNGYRCEDAAIRLGICRDLTERRDWVLDRMHEDRPNLYTKASINSAKAKPLRFVFASENDAEKPIEAVSRNFIRYAAKNVPNELETASGRPGESVTITTIDAPVQKKAFEIVERSMKSLQTRVDTACRKQHVSCSVIESDGGIEKVRPQAALVAIDPKNGEILAMVGGIGTAFNYATDARRDPGSCLKPFFACKAVESGSWQGEPVTPASIFDPSKDQLLGRCAQNHLGRRAGLREALAKSYNFAACGLAASAGIPVDFVGALTGSDPRIELSSAIGESGETTLLDLAAGYTIFAQGKFASPTPFRAVYKDGVKIDLGHVRPRTVVDPGAAWIVADMLGSVIEAGGTAPNFRKQAGLQSVAYRLGAKTGTGQTADLTIVVFSPSVVVAVRVSMPMNKPELRMSDGFSGASTAGPIAAEFLKYIKHARPDWLGGEFARPSNVVTRQIDRERGCQMVTGGIAEFFLVGREPQMCEPTVKIEVTK
ncbi:MAG: penicillin-binding protein [Acidobacteria bacterium]|nr:penicillin-binding protein [Acidobacteriota bacterium]